MTSLERSIAEEIDNHCDHQSKMSHVFTELIAKMKECDPEFLDKVKVQDDRPYCFELEAPGFFFRCEDNTLHMEECPEEQPSKTGVIGDHLKGNLSNYKRYDIWYSLPSELEQAFSDFRDLYRTTAM